MTSHDVVGRCRRFFGTRKVGHAGTLDPMATGVLVLGIERATKILGLLTATDKSYAATIRLGQTTSTEDAQGAVLQSVPASHLTDPQIESALARWRGDIDQIPSAVSAIKVDGVRSYQLVRQGRAVELKPRRVRVDRFEVRDVRRGNGVPDGAVDVEVAVDCSSGTYIRALARDLGAGLGVGGHLTVLRRTRVGTFGLEQARTLDQLEQTPRLSYTIDEACLQAFPRRDLTAAEAEDASHGRALRPAGLCGVYAATAADGRVISLLEDAGSRTKSVVVVRPATL
ncbi:MAG: tRNA pseudouridine(55) synthase TruB [Actinomycetia bacterium]|nr:tRNA pseudouridine(55) synthase TruB [Actinomycetes bacterium]MCH9760707.1 tRNA pseudouridine(55) synthase TruB [Actinomycetes bacterium]